MREFGLGLIGCGMIANVHAKAISTLGGIHLAACFTPTPGRAEAFAAKVGCRGYDKVEAFLADPDLDIVIVGTPSGVHLDGALAAIAAGKHVLVEKPLEVTVERCDRIIEAAERKGVRLGGLFHSRYFEVPKLIKKAVEQGRFGKIAMADAQVKWYRSQEYYDSGAWRGTLKLDGGGALMNQAIHAIDLLQWFMGPVTRVEGSIATLTHERIEVEDTAVATLRFASGALGVIEGTTSAYPGFLKKIEICGSRGSVVMEEENITAWDFLDATEEDAAIKKQYIGASASTGGAADPKAISFQGHALEIADFVGAVREGRPFMLEGREARKAVEIIEGVYRSARTGQAVDLPLAR